MIKNHRSELQEYFRTHNKSKEQKAHTSKVSVRFTHGTIQRDRPKIYIAELIKLTVPFVYFRFILWDGIALEPD